MVEELLNKLEEIREEAKPLVEKRWVEFENLRNYGNEDDLFSELSFCVLTANWSAQGGIKAQKLIGHGFSTLNQEELADKLREVGHRYPDARAQYIVTNRWIIGKLREVISTEDPREYLVKNIKGLGWKETSHFLRNVAFTNYAILDKHVLRVMNKYGLIEEIPKGWTKKKYLDYEERLRKVSDAFGEHLGKFDLYLWYMIKKTVDK
ncbi:MAG: N-glycosylase/DNA lyase [Fervidobacterium sp.]|uniref:8-oxoguanine DNA glycosylase/AP lyase n=1 Tax=Fervidobacterium gondwanense DSM 13020 TaxID=1121883 RepID=A0A1M7T3R4_FERGO|nr:N-glycosylase/DNA lyase [Fervidobacterium gondwanense]UXF01725.1 DNA lyase [Fervidobacterium riparium]SHN65348.1 N-glycosylase/DNA lyase [Fervidobacterium gondwanense DSM 13020]